MEYIRLGDCVEIDSGYAFKSSLFNENEGLPIIRIRDVTSGSTSTYYSGKYDDKYLVYDGDLLISMDGSFIVRKWNGGVALLNQRVCRIKSKSRNLLLSDYIYRIIPRFLKNIEDKTPFVTVKHLSVANINEITIPLPSINIQKRISMVLDKAQELIDKRKEQIEACDELIKSLFYYMFGDIFANSKNWSENKLDELINVVGGYAFKSANFQEIGVPVLRIGNINSGYFKPVNMVFYQEEPGIERYLIFPGDLVISLTGTVGKDDYGNVCIIGKEHDKYYLNQRNAKLEIKKNINKYYLMYALKVPEVKKKLTGISRGVRQANIANKDILNLVLPMPPLELQNEFAEKVEKIEQQKQLLEQSLIELENNFNSLIQRAFKGELF